MTGFGEARRQIDGGTVAVEIRSVNNRHLKLGLRSTDPYGSHEPEIERIVRESVRRGSVQMTLRVDRLKTPGDYRLNHAALAGYRDSFREFATKGGDSPIADLSALLQLPGVVEDRRGSEAEHAVDWPTIQAVVVEALGQFQKSRAAEGRAMADELLALGESFRSHLDAVQERAPQVARDYEARLLERVAKLLQDRAEIEPAHLIREVALYADRADVAEEIVRLLAHLEQYRAVVAEPESSGRKLEFVVQEMGRETNTIGSKAGDVAVSRSVVELKSILEKVRELIQNVE